MIFEEALAALRRGKKIRLHQSSRYEYIFLDMKEDLIYEVRVPELSTIDINLFSIRDPFYFSRYLITDEWELFECDTCCIFCQEFCGLSGPHKVHCFAQKDNIWSITTKKTVCHQFSINPKLALHDSSLNALSYTD